MSTVETVSSKRPYWNYKRVLLIVVAPALLAFTVFSFVLLPKMTHDALEATYEQHMFLKNHYGITGVTWDKYTTMYVTLPDGKRATCESGTLSRTETHLPIHCGGVTLSYKP